MSSNAQVGISNKMSDGISPNKAFDMPLATDPPVSPTNPIASLNPTKNTNGGAYTGSSDHLVRGVVAYTIPGSKVKLIIYFDTNKCRLDTVSTDVSITADIVKSTEQKNQAKVTGALVVGSDVYTYTAKAEANLVGDTNQCLVSIVVAMN
ncbi:hypothetical protein B0H14DRAFT_2678537 [Mycena olivaceomarginata]|nr:hypothetical protein B0H14DRAFT_2678537 [Mycena olivaceomarginata]